MCDRARILLDVCRRLVVGVLVFSVLSGVWSAPALMAREVPFSAAQAIDAAFDGAQSLFAADVDGDGDTDVIGAGWSGAGVFAWWENTAGDGSAWAEHAVDSDPDYLPSSVHAADVDGDGDTDLLGTAWLLNEVIWWENTAGDGTAWAKRTVDASFAAALSVHAADVDGDGDLDVLAASEGASISWWENTAGDGSAWTERAVDTSVDTGYSVRAADVDGDGDTDVVGAAAYADEIAWWENTAGGGTAWTKHSVDTAFSWAASVFVADVNGDGYLDILGAATTDDDITWWENDGTPQDDMGGDGNSWTEHTLHADFDGARSVHAADVDGDGDIDVLGAAGVADDVAWWENTAGDGSTWAEHTVGAGFDGAVSVLTADVDGDGDTDVLGAAHDANDLTWWKNETIHRSAMPMTEHTIDADFDGATSVFVADVDGDGDTDVLGAAYDADDVAWWENTAGDGTAWSEHTVDGAFNGPYSVFAADVDGDGDTDVLAGAYDTGEVSWWENTTGHGSAWTERTVDGAFASAVSVFAADVDGDGDVDVLGAAEDPGEIFWWENTSGDGSAWIKRAVDGAFAYAASVFAADVDGDGDTDVLGAGGVDGIVWWENTAGDGSAWTERTIVDTFPAPIEVFAADVDGDGDMDALGAAYAGQPLHVEDIAWWENTAGNGTAWTQHVVDFEFSGALSVSAADVDGDGDTDVLGASTDNDDIAWWENTAGDGTAWTKHTVDAEFDGAASVVAADVDGDGNLDVVGAARNADDIAWWKNRGGQFALTTTSSAPATVQETAIEDLLDIEVFHRGRAGDSDVELATLELLFEETAGDSLTTAEANALVASLRVYLDGDDSGDFGPGDPMVTSLDTLDLDAGVQVVVFVDASADVQVAHGTLRRYFVVVEVAGDAGTETPSQLRVSHLTESSSTGEDAAHDIVLVLEYVADVTTGVIDILDYPELLITPSGSGAGTVTSSPAGIDCGMTCDWRFDSGTPVTLTAVADPGSQFVGWGGDADCLDGAVTMGADLSCMAYFHDQGTRNLTVTRLGSGTGTVTSSPAGIDCGATCTAPFSLGTEVTLTPTAGVGSHFIGWGGDPDCSDGTVTMNSVTQCAAYFDSIGPPQDLVLNGETVNDTQIYSACHSITATNFHVVPPAGDVTFQAGETAVLGEGFEVQDGREFVVELQLPAGCP